MGTYHGLTTSVPVTIEHISNTSKNDTDSFKYHFYQVRFTLFVH